MKQKFKKIITITIAILSLAVFTPMTTSCSQNDNFSIQVIIVDGAPVLTLTQMRQKNIVVDPDYYITYQVVGNPQALQASLIRDTPDFAIVPINMAVAMYNNGDYRLAAITGWGIQHIVTNTDVTTLEGLRGQTIHAFGEFQIPGITLRYILEHNNLLDEVTIVYHATQLDVRNAVVLGTFGGQAVEFAMLAEPVVTATIGVSDFEATIDLQYEWGRLHGGANYPQAALIFHERLLENHTNFLENFVSMAKISSQYAIDNPLIVGNWASNFNDVLAIPNGSVINNAMQTGRLNMQFTLAQDAKEQILAFLSILPLTQIGDQLPSDSFFHSFSFPYIKSYE
ncbi:MAG: hypothetical protein FWE13_01370 [Firmicutes bacterium]|nr:hypothetical protein [Bacillota bacterium]